MARYLLLIAALASALLLNGCATITRGSSEQITIQSDPSGAAIRLSNGFTGMTPATFTVPRKGDLIVTVSKEGYESSEVILKSGLAGAGAAGFVGNALIGGLIGGGIDVATGATLSHTPNPLIVSLKAKMAPPLVAEKREASPAVEPPKVEPPSPSKSEADEAAPAGNEQPAAIKS